jgi:DNA invertase Pin-like site-specific DNA recombinase
MAKNILSAQEPREIKRVAIYARVSTLNGQHPEMQLAELREYAARRGWQVVGEFVDIGVSGSRDSRPELNRCMDVARSRKCDAILVWKLDRWARSLKFLVNNLAELTAYGVAFVSLRDNIDLSTPAGRLMVQMIGAFAEFERSLIVERVRAGMSSARARGKRLGRPSCGITVEQIAALRGTGASWRTVGEKLGVTGATALRTYQRYGMVPESVLASA